MNTSMEWLSKSKTIELKFIFFLLPAWKLHGSCMEVALLQLRRNTLGIVVYPLAPPSYKNWSDGSPCKKGLHAQVSFAVCTLFMDAKDRTGSTLDISAVHLSVLRWIQIHCNLFSYSEKHTDMGAEMHPCIFVRPYQSLSGDRLILPKFW